MNMFFLSRRYALTLCVFLSLFVTGCATGPQRDVTIQESARGGVYLERIPTRQFQASHPVRLAPELIAKTLQGVQIREERACFNLSAPSKTRRPPSSPRRISPFSLLPLRMD